MQEAIQDSSPKTINRTMVLIGLIIGMLFSALEQTIVGTAMPTIIKDLNGFSIFAWVTTAYLITSTTVVPIVGKLADMYGRRLFYLLGVLIFVAGSFLCATAMTMEQLVLYRAVQGIGGGMLMPLSQTIVGDIFNAEQRAKWQGVFGGIFGLSSVIGPFIGGFIVDHVQWHWIFLINVPVGLLSGILIFFGMKHELVAKHKAVIDWWGIVTFVPAIVLLLLGLTFGGKNFAWTSVESFLIFGGAIVLTALFLIIEKKAKEPILDLSLFKNRVFATTNILGFLVGMGMFGAIMFVPMFMQAILGVSPTKAGSTMTPMMLSLIAASIVGGQLLLRIRYRTVLISGMVIGALGFFLMSTMGTHTTQLTVNMYMIILGLGMGLVMPTLMIAVQNQFPREQLGTVTSASTFFRSIGSTIGVTVLNVVMNHALASKMDEALKTDQVTNNPVLSGIMSKLSEKVDDLFTIMLAPQALQLEADIKETVLNLIKTVWTEAFSIVFWAGLIFIVLGVLTACFVGNGRISREQMPQRGKKIAKDQEQEPATEV
ncbi:MDR family MFS transporter [Paenibacillus sp. GCM10027629]|uniref:MDR family MFS transporter n=1 Tax=Paenibacillus sp. GCM10027629 TaxID=3273414 RepID=UPI0036457E54